MVKFVGCEKIKYYVTGPYYIQCPNPTRFGPIICVNNSSHSLGPILGKLIEPTYHEGSNPTDPE